MFDCPMSRYRSMFPWAPQASAAVIAAAMNPSVFVFILRRII